MTSHSILIVQGPCQVCTQATKIDKQSYAVTALQTHSLGVHKVTHYNSLKQVISLYIMMGYADLLRLEMQWMFSIQTHSHYAEGG